MVDHGRFACRPDGRQGRRPLRIGRESRVRRERATRSATRHPPAAAPPDPHPQPSASATQTQAAAAAQGSTNSSLHHATSSAQLVVAPGRVASGSRTAHSRRRPRPQPWRHAATGRRRRRSAGRGRAACARRPPARDRRDGRRRSGDLASAASPCSQTAPRRGDGSWPAPTGLRQRPVGRRSTAATAAGRQRWLEIRESGREQQQPRRWRAGIEPRAVVGGLARAPVAFRLTPVAWVIGGRIQARSCAPGHARSPGRPAGSPACPSRRPPCISAGRDWP